jgi:hypothetical protein
MSGIVKHCKHLKPECLYLRRQEINKRHEVWVQNGLALKDFEQTTYYHH